MDFFVVGGGFFCVLYFGGFFEMYLQRACLLFTDGDKKINYPGKVEGVEVWHSCLVSVLLWHLTT